MLVPRAVDRPVAQAGAIEVAVIGAGSSGLAVVRAVRELGVTVECFERGSDVGGLWRYENDSGLSSAYGSLRTNVSSARMSYPSFPLPKSYGDFPHHTEMAEYLSAYADSFGLREHIRFRTSVERLEPEQGGGWCLRLQDNAVRRFDAVVVAVGHDWCPKLPAYPGVFAGHTSHSHHYRTPEPFAGARVLVVGGGPSAAEIAVEVAGVAKRTCISLRSGTHVIPMWVGGRPYDAFDREPHNRIPWRLINVRYGRAVAREVGPLPPSWPLPSHRLLEGIPIISSDLLPAVRRGAVAVRPAVERLAGDRVRFTDATEEQFDSIIYATGYQLRLPFLAPGLVSVNGREVALYRRIVPPAAPAGIFFAGCVDAPGGLLPLVETQADWIAAVLSGRLVLPPTGEMWRAITRAERRTRQRFPDERPLSIRCDPHAYRRLLRADLRRAARRTLRPRLQPGPSQPAVSVPISAHLAASSARNPGAADACARSGGGVGFVHGCKEPALSRQFGAHYDTYRRAVPAWCPTANPWTPADLGKLCSSDARLIRREESR